MQLHLSDMKAVLMPRLRLLTQLDPDGLSEFNAPQMRELIRPHAEEYRRVVLRDQLPADMDVKGALNFSRSIAISNCSEPLQHGVIILCPARARLTLGIASVGTPFSSCPYSSLQCTCRRGMSEQPCLRGNNARKSVVWQAGGRGVS
jgi:hypothetical protein